MSLTHWKWRAPPGFEPGSPYLLTRWHCVQVRAVYPRSHPNYAALWPDLVCRLAKHSLTIHQVVRSLILFAIAQSCYTLNSHNNETESYTKFWDFLGRGGGGFFFTDCQIVKIGNISRVWSTIRWNLASCGCESVDTKMANWLAAGDDDHDGDYDVYRDDFELILISGGIWREAWPSWRESWLGWEAGRPQGGRGKRQPGNITLFVIGNW